MKIKIQLAFIFTILLISNLGCRKYCDQSSIIGEILFIPLEFKNFTTNELPHMLVYRIDNDNSVKRDTLQLIDLVFIGVIRNNKVSITDNDRGNRYGYYESYFDSCQLIFDWYTGRDTLKNIHVLKSKHVTDDECHKNDLNVRIDEVSFTHKGITLIKGDTVIIRK